MSSHVASSPPSPVEVTYWGKAHVTQQTVLCSSPAARGPEQTVPAFRELHRRPLRTLPSHLVPPERCVQVRNIVGIP
ncbi:hypothetical protein E2C01_082945 [Portunus trituberculatus]|uniref:Uncharacterized protein n=1 Tax=Portunus trituberculatus TaxID=210409 RepID=A0A5B7IZU1_PORTR|nr:hypothetical protein [Portunus trituberculatus]